MSAPKPHFQEVIDLASLDDEEGEFARPPVECSPVYDTTTVENVGGDILQHSVDHRRDCRKRTHDSEEDDGSYLQIVDRKQPRQENQSSFTASSNRRTMSNNLAATSKYAAAPAPAKVPSSIESDGMLAARLQREEGEQYKSNTLSDALLAAALQEESADDSYAMDGGDDPGAVLAAKLPERSADDGDDGDDPDAVLAAKLQKKEDDEERCAVNGFAYATRVEANDASLAAKLHQEELGKKVRDRERERKQMMVTMEGRATLFVEKILEIFDTINVPGAPGQKKIAPVARDDVVFLAECMLREQERFKIAGVDTTVDIGYHYTSEAHMNQIRVDGLLTKNDRLISGSGRHTNGAAFGDGVYTANNPFAFRHFGSVGLIVARLKGKCYRHSQWDDQSARVQYNTCIGRKATSGDAVYSEEVVLTSSAQVIPLARFCSSLAQHTSGSQIKLLETFQKAVEAIVKVYFNDGDSQRDTQLPLRWNVPKRRTESDQGRSLSTRAWASNASAAHNQMAQRLWGANVGQTNQKAVPITRWLSNRTINAWANDTSTTHNRAVQTQRGSKISSPTSQIAVPTASWQTGRKINRVVVPAWPSNTNNLINRRTPSAWCQNPVQGQASSWCNTAPAPAPELVSYRAPLSLQSKEAEIMMEIVEGVSTNECTICLSKLSSRKVASLRMCSHQFHVDCITASLEHSTRCPCCRKPLLELQGKSPSGTMTITSSPSITCQGFPVGAFTITYSLPAGQQHMYHDNPGTRHKGTRRVAYIPSNGEGELLLRRLKHSFRRGLTFTVGTSLTSGARNVVIWSSVHHKTHLSRGAHGYPDPGFFANCNSELDALGVPAAVDL